MLKAGGHKPLSYLPMEILQYPNPFRRKERSKRDKLERIKDSRSSDALNQWLITQGDQLFEIYHM
jgi:hypothetical protein